MAPRPMDKQHKRGGSTQARLIAKGERARNAGGRGRAALLERGQCPSTPRACPAATPHAGAGGGGSKPRAGQGSSGGFRVPKGQGKGKAPPPTPGMEPRACQGGEDRH